MPERRGTAPRIDQIKAGRAQRGTAAELLKELDLAG
jgi:hypothetical protein